MPSKAIHKEFHSLGMGSKPIPNEPQTTTPNPPQTYSAALNSSPCRTETNYSKPESLLERIVKTSSNAGDVVLDPFCGCGTAVVAAQTLNRHWIGIDVTHLAIGLIKQRLQDKFGESIKSTYQVFGEPTDIAGARRLAEDDKFQFEAWALSMVGARPSGQVRRGADKGIDGRLFFHDDSSGKSKQIILSVKGGHVEHSHIRDLRGVLDREEAQIGVLITLEHASRPMLKEAASAGFYNSPAFPDSSFPRMQILTIEDMLAGHSIQFPRMLQTTLSKRLKPNPKPRKTSSSTSPKPLLLFSFARSNSASGRPRL